MKKLKQRTSATWYEQLSLEDRDRLNAVAEWLRPIPWQWFVTLTFPWDVRVETANLKLRKWINAIERVTLNSMCFVCGQEHRIAESGTGVPWHFHLLVTSKTALPKELLERSWWNLVGKGKRQVVDGKVTFESALVEPYYAHLRGPEYCLKCLADSEGSWSFRWLALFNPSIPGTMRPNHRTLRQRARSNRSS